MAVSTSAQPSPWVNRQFPMSRSHFGVPESHKSPQWCTRTYSSSDRGAGLGGDRGEGEGRPAKGPGLAGGRWEPRLGEGRGSEEPVCGDPFPSVPAAPVYPGTAPRGRQRRVLSQGTAPGAAVATAASAPGSVPAGSWPVARTPTRF